MFRIYIMPCIVWVFYICFSFNGFSQSVSGTTQDEQGLPLAGTNVSLKGTSMGTLTDQNGRFELNNVPIGDYVIKYSFIGYKSIEESISITKEGITDLNINLEADLLGLEDIVVTGSFNPQSKLESTVSITTLDRKMIDQQAPRSTGDLIDAIPGFYVESSLGEVANNIYPRGLPIGTGGLRYTSLREDGLNSFEISDKTFFNADAYTKVDLTVDHVEGLRGGNAVVFASNTPGGIINFVSKTGGEELKGQVRATLGSQGLYRLDVNFGGPLTNNKKWRFNVGGYYRYDKGLRSFSGPANYGGQIKANITRLFDNDKGYIRFFVKSLNEVNAYWSPVPYRNNSNPTALPGGPDLLYGSLMPSGQGTIYLPDPKNIGQTRPIDLTQHYKINYQSIGAEMQFNLGNGWSVQNKIRYMQGGGRSTLMQIVSNPIAGQDALIRTKSFLDAGYQISYNYVNPGTISGNNYQSGNFVGDNIALNGLSTSGILADGINGNGMLITPGLFIVDGVHSNLMNNLQVSKKIGGHSLTGGVYFSQYSSNEFWNFNSILLDVQSNPRLVDVTLKSPNPSTTIGGITYGSTVNYTGNGVISANSQYEQSNTNNLTVAGFIGDEWKVNDKLHLSLGFRYEINQSRGSLQNTGRRPNTTSPAGTFVLGSPAYVTLPGNGGLDSNPSTLYDNNADIPINGTSYYDIAYEVWGANFGLNYLLTETQALFLSASRGARYSNTQNFLANKDQYSTATGAINLRNPIEEILQGEIGYRLSGNKIALTTTIFGAQLTNSPFSFQSADASGNIKLDVLLYDVRNIGWETELVYAPVRNLKFNTAITLQKPIYTKYPKITVNTINVGPEEVDFSGNQVERIPNLQIDFTTNYKIANFDLYANARYIGERMANRRNTYTFNPYVEIGAGINYTNNNFSIGLQGTNLFNAQGITEGNTRTQDNFDKNAASDPNAIGTALFILPRSINLVLDYKF